MIATSIVSTKHPILAQIIPIRKCNLDCAYCNEYDKVSEPVPTEKMIERIDQLAAFGTSIIVFSGGEPLLHPDLDQLITRIRSHGVIAGLITNGYLLTKDRIEKLGKARLDYLQISIDNVKPDDVSMKSLKVLDKKLGLLAEHAIFQVNINSVLGSGINNPEDALTVAERAIALGFSNTVGVIHNKFGQLKPLSEHEKSIYKKIKALGKKSFARIDYFQKNIVNSQPNNWRCRAGARYLYICEDGLVHYCSQMRGKPGISLRDYTRENIRREFYTKKVCAPMCTISCVHQASFLDNWRAPQNLTKTR